MEGQRFSLLISILCIQRTRAFTLISSRCFCISLPRTQHQFQAELVVFYQHRKFTCSMYTKRISIHLIVYATIISLVYSTTFIYECSFIVNTLKQNTFRFSFRRSISTNLIKIVVICVVIFVSIANIAIINIRRSSHFRPLFT